MSQELQGRILELVREYYQERHAARPFVPGESQVPYAGRVFDDREMTAAVEAVLDFWLTLGPQGEAFERELAAYTGARHALMVNSGSSANLVAVATLTSPQLDRPLRPGDEVLTVAAGFPTTVAPILQHGCGPGVRGRAAGDGQRPRRPPGGRRHAQDAGRGAGPHPRQPVRPRHRPGRRPPTRPVPHRG